MLFRSVTRLTTVGKYSTSGGSSSPVPGSTYGVISNVASVHAIVSHNTLSAKKRPGQILCIYRSDIVNGKNIDGEQICTHLRPNPKTRLLGSSFRTAVAGVSSESVCSVRILSLILFQCLSGLKISGFWKYFSSLAICLSHCPSRLSLQMEGRRVRTICSE